MREQKRERGRRSNGLKKSSCPQSPTKTGLKLATRRREHHTFHSCSRANPTPPDHRDDSSRPLPGSDGDTARSAGKVAISTLKFLHRARAERDYLLSTMD